MHRCERQVHISIYPYRLESSLSRSFVGSFPCFRPPTRLSKIRKTRQTAAALFVRIAVLLSWRLKIRARKEPGCRSEKEADRRTEAVSTAQGTPASPSPSHASTTSPGASSIRSTRTTLRGGSRLTSRRAEKRLPRDTPRRAHKRPSELVLYVYLRRSRIPSYIGRYPRECWRLFEIRCSWCFRFLARWG
jgi:hypothetical protein